jgi:hypothetical protein
VGLLTAPIAGAQDVPMTEHLALRLRDVPLVDVVFTLHMLTGQGYVVDADVVGRVDVEVVDTSAEDVEAALAGLGLSFSPPGTLRRVTAGGHPATLRLPGRGYPIDLSWRAREGLPAHALDGHLPALASPICGYRSPRPRRHRERRPRARTPHRRTELLRAGDQGLEGDG